ncbi:hypothetical protein RRSWK_02624 [Rhodopirellula sp. SWK7]|nr:hypothetical protein RRSWK_02624 [Rhodopirellula sp. SWK7]
MRAFTRQYGMEQPFLIANGVTEIRSATHETNSPRYQQHVDS